jgi:hypothetical protein
VIAGQLFRPEDAPSYGYPLKVPMILVGGVVGIFGLEGGVYVYEFLAGEDGRR